VCVNAPHVVDPGANPSIPCGLKDSSHRVHTSLMAQMVHYPCGRTGFDGPGLEERGHAGNSAARRGVLDAPQTRSAILA
jgi:hypothetical protein